MLICMHPAQRHLAALDRCLRALTESVAEGDAQGIWEHLLECLGWLYRAEEVLRAHDPRYYFRRDSVPAGRLVGGLIYFRSQVDHAVTGEAYRDRWLKAPLLVMTEDGPKETVPWVMTADGTLVPMPFRIRSSIFPPLLPGARDRRHRDAMYREHVEGQPLSGPLTAASAFLLSVSEGS